MLTNKIMVANVIKTVVFSMLVSSLFYAGVAYAQAAPNIGTLLENLAAAKGELMRLVTAIAYVLGMLFIYKGIGKLKEFGESRTMMSHQHHLREPLTYLFVGAALLYLPTTVWTGLYTLWSEPNPYAYTPETADPWSELIKAAFMILELIGTIAFIRGLVLLSRTGAQSHQPGGFGKAMAHMVAGILCINMYQFVQAVINTLALGQG